eukprot:SAG11_NODE_15849_length_564_cov_1.432258_2_plen_39_part_01
MILINTYYILILVTCKFWQRANRTGVLSRQVFFGVLFWY